MKSFALLVAATGPAALVSTFDRHGLDSAWVERAGWTLIHTVWQFAFIALVATVLHWSLRRRSPRARYVAGVSLLGAMAVAPCITFCVVDVSRPAEGKQPRIASIRTTDETPSRAALPLSHSPLLESADDESPGQGATPPSRHATEPRAALGTHFAPRVAPHERPLLSWLAAIRSRLAPRLPLLVSLWLAGLALFSLRPVWGLWMQWRLRRVGLSPVPASVTLCLNNLAQRLGLRRTVGIAQSVRVGMPMAVGYLRPLILLPGCVLTGLTAAQLEALLAHELAHIRRHDWLVNAFQLLVETVFFYHPAVWWLSRQIRQERENCCDDLAVSLVGDRGTVGRMLLALEELRERTPSLALAATGGNLLSRVRRVVAKGRQPEPASREWLPAAVLLLLAGLGGATWAMSANDRVLARSEVGQSHAAKTAWLQGSGKDLRIKIAGEIVDHTGAPVENCKLTVTLKTDFAGNPLPIEVDGNRFQVWVPLGELGWFNVHLNAVSSDGRQVARQTIFADQLRQAAIDGIKLTLIPPERFLDVTVIDNGRPVRDAIVLAEVITTPLTAKTDDKGVARFPLFNRDQLSQLTAWTDDFKVGGYLFSRQPPRDPSGSKFTIEMVKCRPRVIRIVNDETKAPVPDLSIALTVGTGPPKFQSPLETPGRELRTNEKGEAIDRWFPDWKTYRVHVESRDPRWITVGKVETVGDAILVKVKKSRFEARKRVVGHIASAGTNLAGFYVEMWSYQGEQEHRFDVLRGFTDANGAFAAEYLPGATYCVFVNDARYVSNIIDLVPYDPLTNKTSAPSVTVLEGQPVEVTVTSGRARTPVAYQWVDLQTPHEYSWLENGERHRGRRGRHWWVTTDEHGMARTIALPGKISGSLYTPDWQTEVTAEVKPGGLTRLEFHREIDAARKITGRLLPAAAVAADLSEAVLEIGSLDGETEERMTRKTNAKGEFTFDSKASRIGIYAHTKDAKAAAVAIVDHPGQPIELSLKPTGEFHGRLLGKDDQPLALYVVRANVPIIGKDDFSKPRLTRFRAASFEARTDQNGNYEFSGLPCETVVKLFAASSPNGSDDERLLDEIYLVPHESRPLAVSRLWKREQKLSFAERYERTLRDCRLSHFGAMAILFRPAKGMQQFVDTHLESYATTRDAMAFMQIEGSLGDESSPEIENFARSKKWPLPEKGKVVAVAMDPAGRELGRIEIDVKDPAAPKLASDFIRRYAPPPVDARNAWDEAFAQARESGRKVWVRISQRSCRPCFELTRWLDDQKELLSQDYVFLKIDDVRDLHGAEVAKRLPGSKGEGIPYFVIFDANAKPLITSEAPLGNIGCPSGFEGKKHLRKMLTATRSRLTDEQINEIVGTLGE